MYNKLSVYNSFEELSKSEFIELESYHWESESPYRPKTYFKLGVVDNSLVAVLKCYEENPRAVFGMRDAPVYRDSCLEFFVAPLADRDEYVNVEMNSKGVFLSEFGKGKHDRVLVSSLTQSCPLVESFRGDDENGSFWGVIVKITKAFISSLYKVNDDIIDFAEIKANFYKCGDDCEIPHYIAFSPVSTLPPGFHNPECFAVFKKEVN